MKRHVICFALLLCFLTVGRTAVFAATQNRITVGTFPDFAAVNPARNLVYVSNSGNGTVSVIDGTTNAVTATIAVGGQPQGIAVNPATNKIYVALFAGLSSTVSVIDGSTNEVVESIEDPGATYVAVDTKTNMIFTSDSDNTVRAISGRSGTVVGITKFDSVLEQLAIDVTRNLIYVSVVGSIPSIAVINGSTYAVVNTISLPQAQFLPGLAFDSSLNLIYVSDSEEGKVFVVNGATGAVVNTIGLTGASNPKYVAIGARHQVIVADPGADRIFFINGSTQALTGSQPLKWGPWGLAVNPITRNIYVPLSLGSWVAAIAP